MTRTALQTYLDGVETISEPTVLALDKAIRTAHPGFDVAIKYGILMYAIDADWRTWVCWRYGFISPRPVLEESDSCP